MHSENILRTSEKTGPIKNEANPKRSHAKTNNQSNHCVKGAADSQSGWLKGSAMMQAINNHQKEYRQVWLTKYILYYNGNCLIALGFCWSELFIITHLWNGARLAPHWLDNNVMLLVYLCPSCSWNYGRKPKHIHDVNESWLRKNHSFAMHESRMVKQG